MASEKYIKYFQFTLQSKKKMSIVLKLGYEKEEGINKNLCKSY